MFVVHEKCAPDAYIHTYMHAYVHAYMHIHTYTHALNHTCMHAYHVSVEALAQAQVARDNRVMGELGHAHCGRRGG